MKKKRTADAVDKTDGHPTPYTLLDLSEVEPIVGFRRTTIKKMCAEGEFPQGVKIGPRMIRWRSDEIEAWLDAASEKRA